MSMRRPKRPLPGRQTGATRRFRDTIRRHIETSIATKHKIMKTLLPDIEKAARLVIGALLDGKKVLFFGNGGSASDAQHLAAEFVGRYERERRPLAALALTTDTSILTAVSNDYAFSTVFSRQVEALGQRGDVAVGISTSGNSENVIHALDKARMLGLKTISFTGKSGGKMRKADAVIHVQSDITSRIQEAHIMIGHIICDLVDEALIPRRS